MNRHPRNNLIELLTRLSGGGAPHWARIGPGVGGLGGGQPGLARLSQVILLAKEGLREYGDRLDALERQIQRQEFDRDGDRCDGQFRTSTSETSTQGPVHATQEESDSEDQSPLTPGQIDRLFERLAIQGTSLNRRGYPFTCEVNTEQEKLYPKSLLMTREQVEVAWDDWKDEGARRLFCRSTDARNGCRLKGDEDQVTQWKSGDRARSTEDRGTPRRQRLFIIFDELLLGGRYADFARDELPKLREVNRKLAECGEPLLMDELALRREWREYLVHAARTRETLLHANGADSPSYPVRKQPGAAESCEDGRESEAAMEESSASVQLKGGFVQGGRSRSNDECAEVTNPQVRVDSGRYKDAPSSLDRTFRVFDELLLNPEYYGSIMTEEHLPRLSEINRRLEEMGELTLENETTLQWKWRDYLVAAARTRAGKSRNGKLSPEATFCRVDQLSEREPVERTCQPRSREPIGDAPPRERIFQIFDAVLLGGDISTSELIIGATPRFEEINRRLRESGDPVLPDESAFHREWRDYLVVVARTREQQFHLSRCASNGGT